MSNRPSRVAFVGNIPYGVPEEQLTNIFSEVGPVISFRLVFDRETGKPKGYGFCEYHDVETAMCAVRNLNNYEVNGRQLRVAFAENELSEQRDRNERSGSGASADYHHSSSLREQKPRHESASVPISNAATPSVEMINTALASMSSTQLLEVLTQMKSLIQSNADEARQILGANPQLSYALFQALLMMGLVDTNIVMKLTQNFQPQAASVTSNVPAPIPGHILKGLEGIPEQQRNLLLQILQMSQEQINALPPDQRQHVLTIKNQLLASNQ
jgi:cleavage stimulation factor subunit 2